MNLVSDLQQRLVQRQSGRSERGARSQALLQIWLSPAFPIGAFAYSHGLEAAVDRGWVTDRHSLEPWLSDLVTSGSLRNDLILLAAAWRATVASEPAQLHEIAELGAALQPSAERFLEATQQGRSLMQQIAAAWPAPAPIPLPREIDDVIYAVALGIVAALHEIPLTETLRAYAVAFFGNLTSAAIRLSIIGPTEAQQITAALLPKLIEEADRAENATLDDIGSATWRSDLASLLHETQHTRLFRS